MKDLSIVFIIGIISISIMLIIINGCNQHEKTTRAFAEKGYVQKQKIGSVGLIWVKEHKKHLTNRKTEL